MKAMVLAAGIGSRLRPLTDDCPKALVPVGGVPMLEIVIRRMIKAGVDAVVVNVHHLPDKIEAFLKSKNDFDIRIELSREPELLETGGGLKKAASFFDDDRPFFLQAADIFSEIDLASLYRFHLDRSPLATLAVHPRGGDRSFLFDRDGALRGWESSKEKRRKWAGKEVEPVEAVNFDGIHVISPAIFSKMTEEGAFSITDVYLRLAAAGERILAHRSDGSFWATIGDTDRLEALRRYVERAGLKI